MARETFLYGNDNKLNQRKSWCKIQNFYYHHMSDKTGERKIAVETLRELHSINAVMYQ